jgi:replicative DNA helicase
MPWKRLHRQLHGFALGTVNFVSALEGGGKSVFALQWALHVAGKTYLDERVGALFFSMEMPVDDMVNRSILHLANAEDGVGLTWGELQTGKTREGGELGGWKLASIDAATATLKAMPFVFEPRRKTISEIKLVVRRVKTQMRAVGVRLRAVVIDHVHLLKLDDQRRGTYSEGLAESVNGFKDLALDEELVVLAPAQLTQDAARREGKIVVGDIRDAAAIKQIGDNIVLIDRPWIKMADKSTEKARAARNDATFIAGKVRNGAAGEVPARDGGGRFRFDEMDRDMAE